MNNKKNWSEIIKALKKQIEDIENGIDYQDGLLIADEIVLNATTLAKSYKEYPQGDDRPHKYLNTIKIGFDIDEIFTDFVSHYNTYLKLENPHIWTSEQDIKNKFEELKDNKQFWSSLPKRIKPSELNFRPFCYVTTRKTPIEWTEEWLIKQGFPVVPIHTINLTETKLEVVRKTGVDLFIETKFDSFVELNKGGVCTFLLTKPYNVTHEIGYKRLQNLNDVL